MSYASAARSAAGVSGNAENTGQQGTVSRPPTDRTNTTTAPRRKFPEPTQRPKRESESEAVYILTILTDQPHHDRMTALRKRYFPRHLNKLDAHLTLFHALPESKLESSILPTIQGVVSQTQPFKVRARTPGQLGKHGIGIFIPRNSGGDQIRDVHHALQESWKREGFLSVQDSGGMKAHYTIMNKVDDEAEVDRAFDEVKQSFRGDEGMAEGLGLWRYDRGRWVWSRGFKFEGGQAAS